MIIAYTIIVISLIRPTTSMNGIKVAVREKNVGLLLFVNNLTLMDKKKTMI